MRILNGQVGMESGRSYASSTIYSMGVGAGSVNGMFTKALSEQSCSSQVDGNNRRIISTGGDLSDIASQFKALTNSSKVTDTSAEDTSDTLDKIRQQIIKYLMQLLFGYDNSNEDESDDASANLSSESSSGEGTFINLTQGYEETEETEFSTEGTVQTSDGRQISFGVDLKMSRSFSEYYSQTIGYSSQLCDPLVINMDTGMTEIEDQTFLFDLDGDGTKDEVSQISGDSGFLSLDLNDNGEIDDGNELFGTKSGNGFADLAKYDSDGNGWIDENDPVWDRLRIWTKDSDGNDMLYKLSDKGVGAVCLDSASTDFSQRSMTDGQLNGQVRRTGIFLYENGSAGTIQHVDLALKA